MLREINNVRQIHAENRRRWFTSSYFDLILWIGLDDHIRGFQLCYDKQGYERALTWRGGYFRHHGVDDGESPGLHFKSTPILVSDGYFDPDDVLARFQKEAVGLPEDIVCLVTEHLRAYPSRR